MKKNTRLSVLLLFVIVFTNFSNVKNTNSLEEYKTSDIEKNIVLSSNADFLTFSFSEDIKSININSSEHKIDVVVYSTVNISSLVATFTISSGAELKVESIIQESGITSNDFTNPLTYTIIAEDDTTKQDWVVTVNKNSIPVVENDFYTMDEDSGLTTINVMNNDLDEDDDKLTITNLQSDTSLLRIGVNEDGNSIIIWPFENYFGEIVVNYSLSDGHELSEVGVLTINVEPLSDKPVTRDDVYTLFINSNTTYIDVLANDYDPDNYFEDVDKLEILYAVTSGKGEVSVSEDKSLIGYKPEKDFLGIEEVTYIISDGTFDTAGKLIVSVSNGTVQLNEIYSFTFSAGSGGTLGHDDFGIKSHDIFSDMLSGDMALSGDAYSWYKDITSFEVTQDFTDDKNKQVWEFYFRLIKKCNFLIGKIENVENFSTSDTLRPILGQTKVIRAYSYFYLTQYFQKEYLPGEKILPILTNNGDFYQALHTSQNIFELIKNDFIESIDLLEDFNRFSKRQVNQSIAKGIYAYVLAAIGENDKAYNMAIDAINSEHTIMSSEEVVGGFNNLNTNGWMWGIDIYESDNITLSSWWAQIDYFTYGYAAVGNTKAIDEDLYNQINEEDVRKQQFSYQPENKEHLMPLNKFYDSDRVVFGSRLVKSDYLYMRVAEMHLLAAEMASKLGDEVNAKNYLKNIVSRRVSNSSYIDNLTGNDLLNEIYLQTRIELWGEGKVYLAMKRNKKVIKRGANHLTNIGIEIPHNDDRLTFNIPEGYGYTINDPTLSLIGESEVETKLGMPYNDSGAYAEDKDKNDISEFISINGNVDYTTLGEYTLVYSVFDQFGNAAIPVKRKVIVVNSLSVEDSFKAKFSIFPNPTENSINIATNEKLKSVEIISVRGERILKETKNTKSLNLKHLSKGVYIIKVETDKGGGIEKFIKN